jgi:hypothetical protein
VERTLRRRPVTEERHDDVAAFAQLGGHGSPVGDRKARRDDAVCTEDAQSRIGDVHGSTAASVRPAVLCHQFGEHPLGVEALGQAVAMAAVGRGDHVLAPERPAGPDGGSLLADGEMDEAGNKPIAVEVGHALFEPADQQHLALHLDQIVAGHRGLRSLHARVLY